ncbi:MAG: hypothetical protein IPM79_07050 [Polyangiaceae bacterium]|nr:hypothetical protein [Polyangiaceae bacterium]MBK8937395.1 hypothetical protein [Polyangiaceae bacterium]
MSARPTVLFALLLSTLAPLAACGSSQPEAKSAEAEASRPRDAAKIAQQVIGGKYGALVHVNRARGNPSAAKFLQVGLVKELLEGTSFEPLNDIERVFVTGVSASDPRAVVFAEHNLTQQRIPQVVVDLVNKSEPKGQVLMAGPYEWRVKVQKKGRGGVLAFIPPRYLVLVPEDLVGSLDAFEQTGGLPLPTGEEVAKFSAEDPSNTLRAKFAPTIPPTVSNLAGDVFLKPDGGVNIQAIGQSTATTAQQDAADLTKSVDDATSMNLGKIKIRAFKAPVFVPEGDRIVTQHDLSQGEVETIMSVAASFIQ